jgi:hypothetical protein
MHTLNIEVVPKSVCLTASKIILALLSFILCDLWDSPSTVTMDSLSSVF